VLAVAPDRQPGGSWFGLTKPAPCIAPPEGAKRWDCTKVPDLTSYLACFKPVGPRQSSHLSSERYLEALKEGTLRTTVLLDKYIFDRAEF
jgi:hypothetical protein